MDLDRVLTELSSREPLLHRREWVFSAETFDAEVSDDFWEVGASGEIYSREHVRAAVLQRLAASIVDECERDGWVTHDPRVRRVGSDTYLLTYRLHGQDRRTRRATVWHHDSARGWHALYHQGTVITTVERDSMKLRKARIDEVNQIQHLMYATIDASYAGHYPPRALPLFKQYHSIERITQRMDDGWFVVVEDAGELVGTGTLVGEEIFAVFVKSSRQGERIGSTIMDALEEHAVLAGLRRVRLDASLPSTGFYQARGYQLLDACSMDAGEGQTLDWIKAEKRLDPVPAS